MSEADEILRAAATEMARAEQAVDEYLTVAEAAKYLGLEQKTIRKYIASKTIKGVKRLRPSRQLRIPKASLSNLFHDA